MAINKKLIHFNKEDSFTNEKEAGNILDTSIVFVKDAKKIITHSSEYPAVNWGKIKNLFITSEEAKAGDVCFYDSLSGKIRLAKIDNVNITDYPASRFTPIGVVVIPGSHNVYGTGQCGVMSLVDMSCDTPTTGSTSDSYMCWGGYGTETSLPNLDQVCYVGSNGNVGESVIGTYYYASLPSDKFSIVDNPYDPGTSYYKDNDRYIPSPYKADGSFNTEYSRTSSPSSTANAMADFDGIGNSEVLWGLSSSQSGWQTASSITNNSGVGYYPAACCCWRFHTDGTKQEQWYLPACGELGYIMPRFNKINETITNLRNAYGSSIGVTLDTLDCYWSSSEYGSNHARSVYTLDSSVSGLNKSKDYYVRAFLRV